MSNFPPCKFAGRLIGDDQRICRHHENCGLVTSQICEGCPLIELGKMTVIELNEYRRGMEGKRRQQITQQVKTQMESGGCNCGKK